MDSHLSICSVYVSQLSLVGASNAAQRHVPYLCPQTKICVLCYSRFIGSVKKPMKVQYRSEGFLGSRLPWKRKHGMRQNHTSGHYMQGAGVGSACRVYMWQVNMVSGENTVSWGGYIASWTGYVMSSAWFCRLSGATPLSAIIGKRATVCCLSLQPLSNADSSAHTLRHCVLTRPNCVSYSLHKLAPIN